MKTFLIIALSLMFATQAAAACDYPARAKMVDGATATKDDMLETQKSVKTYMSEMNAYLECIDAEEKAAVAELDDPTEEVLESRNLMFIKKHDAAVEEMEIVAAEFNEQVRLFKANSD